MPPKARNNNNNTTKNDKTPPRNCTAMQRESVIAPGVADENEISTQSRILQLRKARFRGAAVPARNVTPVITASPQDAYASPDTASPTPSPSPLHARSTQDPPQDETSSEIGVLQEISNSSLRRKTHQSFRSRSSLPRPSSRGIEKRTTRLSSNRSPSSRHPAITTDTFQPPPLAGTQAENSPSADMQISISQPKRSRIAKPTPPRRQDVNDETSKYIEHLESQLASLSTQVQSLTSPSTNKAQSAKLRALNTESNLLRQELAGWETSFSERLQEQIEQHEVVVGSLRAQLRTIERDSEAMRGRLQMLEMENEEKNSRVVALDHANQDLERRLEFMSELLATSPTKLDLCNQAPFDRRRSPTRPQSLVLPVASVFGNSISSPRRPTMQHSPSNSGSLGERSLTRSSTITSWRQSMPARRPSTPLASVQYSSDEEGDTSESNLPMSPTHRRLYIHGPKVDPDSRRKSRVMRRFYGGANGPRTLILPATSHSAMTAGTTPPAFAAAPRDTHSPMDTNSRAGDLLSSAARKSRVRSATWDEDNALVSRSRRSGSFATLTPSKARQALVDHMPLAPLDLDLPEYVVDELADREAGNRDSMGSVAGLNLYDELKTFEQLDPRSPSSTTSIRKVSGPPEFQDEIDDSQLTESPDQPQKSESDHSIDGTQPLQLLSALTQAVSRALNRQTPGVSSVINNAWDVVTLSRPVLEFRWWLIKILLGDLKKKRALWPQQLNPQKQNRLSRQRGLGISTAPGLGIVNISDEGASVDENHDRILLECLSHVERTGRENKRYSPSAPAISWLRLGVTLMFAVGIALRHGPKTLFHSQQSAGDTQLVRRDEDDIGDTKWRR